MNNNLNKILSYNLSIFGIGYLGYSNIINYTSNGIKVNVSDFGNKLNRAKLLKIKNYPSSKIKIEFMNYSKDQINLQNINVIDNDKIFKLKNSFIFLCNAEYIDSASTNKKLINLLIKNKKDIKKHKPTFVIEFLTYPGKIKFDFINKLKVNGLNLEKDYSLIFAPREDWNFADFKKYKIRPLWSNNNKSINIYYNMLNLFDQEIYKIDKLENLELIANIKNSIEHIQNVFFNQLSLGFYGFDLLNIKKDFNKIYSKKIILSGIGSQGIRLPNSTLNILKGSKNPDQLTLLKEAIHTDFSMFKNISSTIKFNQKDKIAILGLGHHDNSSYEGISPSLELYKDLNHRGLSVKINDPNVNFNDYNELKNLKLFKFPYELSKFDILILTNDDINYTSISWIDLSKYLKCRLVVDTYGGWSKYPWNRTKIKYKLIV